jgi:hypothetical protein
MSELPWLPGVVRAFLMGQSNFTTLIPASRVVFKAPADVTTAFVRIQVPNSAPMSGDGVAWRPLVQVDAYCPATIQDAEKIVWDLVAAAAWSIGRARNVINGGLSFSGRHLDGPIADVDISRGEGSPLSRAVIRAELTLHAR